MGVFNPLSPTAVGASLCAPVNNRPALSVMATDVRMTKSAVGEYLGAPENERYTLTPWLRMNERPPHTVSAATGGYHLYM